MRILPTPTPFPLHSVGLLTTLLYGRRKRTKGKVAIRLLKIRSRSAIFPAQALSALFSRLSGVQGGAGKQYFISKCAGVVSSSVKVIL